MLFAVVARRSPRPPSTEARAYLALDNWDDYGYKTMYNLTYVDSNGRRDIGQVKIGQFGLGAEKGRTDLPAEFRALPSQYFSLGQDDSYYSNLNSLGPVLRDEILTALNDLAWDPQLFERARREDVVGVSLLRWVSPSTVTGQFHRLASGGVRLTDYSFSYAPPGRRGATIVSLDFSVEPESEPPTNIHVLVGRNGVGKTRMLQYMAQALVNSNEQEQHGWFRWINPDNKGLVGDSAGQFANLVSVSFSAFDDFEPLSAPRNKSVGLQYSYVGLKWQRDAEGKTRPPKTPAQLSKEFVESVRVCRSGPRNARWLRALTMLEADPIFSDADLTAITDSHSDTGTDDALSAFQQLSSGHKIVLLTITKLVEVVEERTLVLLDEPEAHLHPPLLSAFIRALSDLMTNRNGVAIIATHSPVVLQEAPRSCVWKIHRSGDTVIVERPAIETFGENIGVLTREVFGLEVTQSGFHRLLADAVAEGESYDDVVRRFGDQLGAEALAIVRALSAESRRSGST